MIYQNVSKYIQHVRHLSAFRRTPTSDEIRKIFLDFFIESNGHKFIRSSPVVPFCDPTVAFVNAGMNQFKSIFLGRVQPPYGRVANSQKCIRVGGKHNDLSAVGKDGYHHTFFEMLGNWSFGDYFKKEACEMAWNLLRGPYQIDPSRLYVTYFGGDKMLNLPPDIECRNIWRSLGVPEDRILPFGSDDNFWEMGTTGPCGPCTEIHVDHLPNSVPALRAKFVNADQPDLTELWNIVFIEYNRNVDGTITQLPEKHIDTGMGMERLTAILQNKSNNYETDLFLPIFGTIESATKFPPYTNEFNSNVKNYVLDSAYRTIADHSRMITACLSDGMLPDQNHKLRRIIRKTLLLAENTFKSGNLLHKIIPQVTEMLGKTYPEMQNNLSDVLEILSYEREIMHALRSSYTTDIKKILAANKNLEELDVFDSPGFVSAYKELQSLKSTFTKRVLPGELIFKLHDTYGLDDEAIEKLAEIEGLQLDTESYLQQVEIAKNRTKSSFRSAVATNQKTEEIVNLTSSLNDTIDFYKYNYFYNDKTKYYEFPTIETKIVGLIQNGKVVKTIRMDDRKPAIVITEKSNFYCESGGQQCDQGIITKGSNLLSLEFNIRSVDVCNGCICHSGNFSDTSTSGVGLSLGDKVLLSIDPIRRTRNILHHTATHLLNGSIRHLFKRVTYQLSSSVTADCLKLELAVLGRRITNEDLSSVETLVRQVIKNNIGTSVKTILAQDIFNIKDIVMVPGEIYPETGLRLISIHDSISGLHSKELCCGTHVLSSAEIGDFSITNFKQIGRSKYQFIAVAGDLAANVAKNSERISSTISSIDAMIKKGEKADNLEIRLQKLRSEILNSEVDLPFLVKIDCIDRINDLLKGLKEMSRSTLKEFIEVEMKNVLQENPITNSPYIVHFLKSSTMMEEISLSKATRLCPDRPILVISLSDGMVKARCCVPKEQIEKLSAQEWLEEFAKNFSGVIAAPKDKNPKEVCNMKAKKVQSASFYEKLEDAINETKKFASIRL